MIKRIDHIAICVKDVEAAVKVFQKMGFKLLYRIPAPFGTIADVKLPGANQPIFELIPAGAQHMDGKTGIYHIAFLVDNAQETLDDLESKGVRIGTDHPHFLKQTGRTHVDLRPSPDTEGWGSFFLQFVQQGSKPPVTL